MKRISAGAIACLQLCRVCLLCHAQNGFSGESCTCFAYLRAPPNLLLCAGDGFYMICNGVMGEACMMECTGGTCGQRNNGLLVASPCDERLTQLWLIQQSSKQLENAGKQKSCVPSKAGPWLRQQLTVLSATVSSGRSVVERNLSIASVEHVPQNLSKSAGSGHCLTAAQNGSLTASSCDSQATTQSWSLLQNGTFASLGQVSGLSLCSAGMLQCGSAAMQSMQGAGQLLAAAGLRNSSAQIWSLRRPGESLSVLLELTVAAAWGPLGKSYVPL